MQDCKSWLSLQTSELMGAARPQRWSIFQGDGMVNDFFRPPLPSMVFNGFDKVGPSPLNFFGGSNHWNQCFFDGLQNFEGNGQQWF